MDSRENAKEFILETGLPFPTGYGLPLEDTAKKLGLYYQSEKRFFHAAGFVLNPKGVVVNAVYSSGPIGRLDATNTLDMIEIAQKK